MERDPGEPVGTVAVVVGLSNGGRGGVGEEEEEAAGAAEGEGGRGAGWLVEGSMARSHKQASKVTHSDSVLPAKVNGASYKPSRDSAGTTDHDTFDR